MTTMDMTQLIGTLGFPIVMCGVICLFFSQWLKGERQANLQREAQMAERIVKLEERDHEKGNGLIRESIQAIEGARVRDEMILQHLQSCQIGQRMEKALDRLTEHIEKLTVDNGKA